MSDQIEYEMIGQGNTAEVYQYGEGYILKLFRDSMPMPAIELEYRITKIVQEHYEEMPKALELVEYKNRHGIVYEQIQGVNLIQLLSKNALKIKEYTKMFASVHASMHQKEVDVHYSLKDKLKRDIDSCQDLVLVEKEAIKQYIDRLPEKRQLCHFDFHPGNIMVANQKPYVIDWMTACTGDANADVARTMLLMQVGEMMHINRLKQFVLRRLTKKIGNDYFREYQRQTGILREEVEDWILPVAAARLSEWITDHERDRLVTLVRKKLAALEKKQ